MGIEFEMNSWVTRVEVVGLGGVYRRGRAYGMKLLAGQCTVCLQDQVMEHD
jgi:hypothetical protein